MTQLLWRTLQQYRLEGDLYIRLSATGPLLGAGLTVCSHLLTHGLHTRAPISTFMAAPFRTSLNLAAMQTETESSMGKESTVCIHTVGDSMARDRKTVRLYPTASHSHTICVVF